MKIVAILSTTVLPLDGVYQVVTLNDTESEKLLVAGTPHYIGHPATKAIVDGLGAIHTQGLFPGLQVGEVALAVSIKQGQSTRAEVGHTVHQDVDRSQLSFRLVERLL